MHRKCAALGHDSLRTKSLHAIFYPTPDRLRLSGNYRHAGPGRDGTRSTGLTFEKASAMVNPDQHYDEQAIDSIFAAIGLPKVQAERYVWDADYGGNSPAISYVWGYGVELKDWTFKATAEDYHGVHFNFFFDKSKKTGLLKTLTIITSDSQWYEKFMADAKAAGMKLNGYLDKAVYQREGKEYMLKKGEQTFYFINDFSADGKYEVEFGFDNGIDV